MKRLVTQQNFDSGQEEQEEKMPSTQLSCVVSADKTLNVAPQTKEHFVPKSGCVSGNIRHYRKTFDLTVSSIP